MRGGESRLENSLGGEMKSLWIGLALLAVGCATPEAPVKATPTVTMCEVTETESGFTATSRFSCEEIIKMANADVPYSGKAFMCARVLECSAPSSPDAE